MSKQIVLLALVGMMLLALAVNAQTGDGKKAEVLKRHQSKYGAKKHTNVSVLDAFLAWESIWRSGGCRKEWDCSGG